MLGRFNEDLASLTRAIRMGDGQVCSTSSAYPRHPPLDHRDRPGDGCARLRSPARRAGAGRAAAAALRFGRLTRRDVVGSFRILGVRLRLAHVAAGIRVPRAPPGAAPRRAPRALRLFPRASRHAPKSPGSCSPRPRRFLPRHRVPRRRARASYVAISTRARAGDQRLSGSSRPVDLLDAPQRRVTRSAICRSLARALPACCRSRRNLHLVRQGHGRSASTAITCWPPPRKSRRSVSAPAIEWLAARL